MMEKIQTDFEKGGSGNVLDLQNIFSTKFQENYLNITKNVNNQKQTNLQIIKNASLNIPSTPIVNSIQNLECTNIQPDSIPMDSGIVTTSNMISLPQFLCSANSTDDISCTNQMFSLNEIDKGILS